MRKITPFAAIVLNVVVVAYVAHDANADCMTSYYGACTAGLNDAIGPGNYGVFGEDESPSGYGSVGVYGESASSIAVEGNALTAGSIGVLGTNGYDVGVEGTSLYGNGVFGASTTSLSAYSTATEPVGILAGVVGSGSGTSVYGGYFTSSNGDGLWSSTLSATGNGITADTLGTGAGVSGTSLGGNGVYGISNGLLTQAGVAGSGAGSGTPGVFGESASGYGVRGFNDNGSEPGVYGESGTVVGCGIGYAGCGIGVEGYSIQGTGVEGYDDAEGIGVNAVSVGGIAVYANSSGGTTGATGAFGVFATSGAAGGTGVFGSNTYSTGYGNGVSGKAASVDANGVNGENTGGGTGVAGTSSGTSSTSYGVFGQANGGSSISVYGYNTGSGVGVKGYSASGNAGVFEGNVTISGTLTVAGDVNGHMGGSCTCSSDERLKKNIEPLSGTNALDKLLQLKGVTFEWKNPDDHGKHTGTQTGVIAQQVEKVFPNWVGEDGKGFKTVDPDARTVLGLTVEGFRTLKTENDSLKKRVQTLENGGHPVVGAMGNFGGVGTGNLALSLFTLVGAYAISRRKKVEAAS